MTEKKEKAEKRPKTQRILAMIGIIILAGLYILTLISAIITTPQTKGLFQASIFATVVIPFMLYAYMLIYKILKNRNKK